MSNKKPNPRRRPVTKADIIRAKDETYKEAVRFVWAVCLYTLKDKHGATDEDILQFWDELNDVADSIEKGYLNIADIRHVLKREYNIEL